MQGRLSPEVAGRYQYFPINNWREEFFAAKKLGFGGIEWIVSDLSNPIFDPTLRKELLELIKCTEVKITSINLDLFMSKTLNNFSWSEVKWIFDGINLIASDLSLKRVSIPIEEISGVKDPKTANKVKEALKQIITYNSKAVYSLAVETDMSAIAAKNFLNLPNFWNLGIVLDVGNIAAYGYTIREYFEIMPEKIYSIHIKDRLPGIGPSVALGKGAGEFHYLRTELDRLKNLKDITLQTFRSKENYLQDAENAKKFVQELLEKV